MSEVTDLDAGRCHVILSDGETWDTVADGDPKVRFCTEQQDADQEWGDPIVGYRDISVEELVRHYLATKG